MSWRGATSLALGVSAEIYDKEFFLVRRVGVGYVAYRPLANILRFLNYVFGV
jgi:hypothetical protein